VRDPGLSLAEQFTLTLVRGDRRMGTATPVTHAAGGSGGLDLRSATSYTLLVNTASTGYAGVRVLPGDPHVSVLYQKLEGDPATGAGMPFGGDALPPAQRLLIHDWIEQGAHNN